MTDAAFEGAAGELLHDRLGLQVVRRGDGQQHVRLIDDDQDQRVGEREDRAAVAGFAVEHQRVGQAQDAHRFVQAVTEVGGQRGSGDGPGLRGGEDHRDVGAVGGEQDLLRRNDRVPIRNAEAPPTSEPAPPSWAGISARVPSRGEGVGRMLFPSGEEVSALVPADPRLLTCADRAARQDHGQPVGQP